MAKKRYDFCLKVVLVMVDMRETLCDVCYKGPESHYISADSVFKISRRPSQPTAINEIETPTFNSVKILSQSQQNAAETLPLQSLLSKIQRLL